MLPDIRDANKGRVHTLGTLSLQCQIGACSMRVNFVVCERLSVPVILGCDFCDRYVEAIRPRRRLVEMDDGSTVPIIRSPSSRDKDAVPLPPSQKTPRRSDRGSPVVRLEQPYRLKPRTQTWVTLSSSFHGVGVVQPNDKLYTRTGVVLTNGVVNVEPGKPFKVLLANFSNRTRFVQRNQLVGRVLPHPQVITTSALTTGEVLGIADPLEAEPLSETEDESPAPEPESKETSPSAADLDLSHVPEKYREELRSMLEGFSSMYNGELGAINVTEHSIDLQPGTRPVHTNPYREGPKTREIVKAEVERQLKAGVIEPSQSAWASPVVIVPKPDGTPRFCVDYRRLNAVTVRDSYPLPRMDDCIDSLGHARVFTTLDAMCGYWQLPIRPGDMEKTSFTCHQGTFMYNRMPFGLCNAPATFQRALDIILAGYRWQTCLVYLDDVIVFSRNEEDHIRHVREVLTALRDAGVTLKLRKCEFFTTSVKYLGHIIRPGRLEIDLARTAALKQAHHPKDQSELRSFLGCCNVYRRFIRDYTKMAAPLYAKLKKGEAVILDPFNEESDAAFRNLIEAVTNPPVLALPRADLPYSIDTDASAYQLGVALFQQPPEGPREPIGYWSRTLQAAEKNYSTPEKECLAVVWACTVLRPYLQGAPFVVHTDQASLRWLLTTTDGTGRLMRWRLRLSEFDFDVKYKKGTHNSVADCLSRLRTAGDTTTELEDEIPCLPLEVPDEAYTDTVLSDTTPHLDEWEDHDLLLLSSEDADDPPLRAISKDELITEQSRDPFCVKLARQLDRGKLIPFDTDTDGILVRTNEGWPQVVVPRSLVPRVLALAHRPQCASHPGETKLYRTLRRHFYWTTLSVDALMTVRNCVSCARNRVKLRRHAKQLQLFPAGGPLEFVSIDILGPLVRTARGNRYLLVISDRYTKLTRTVPLPRVTASVVARAFATHWLFTYGPPALLLSDNGKQFVSRLFVNLCRIVGTENAFTTTYHPQTNGQVERFNRTILNALRHYVLDNPREWDEFSPALTYAYNTQIHRVTGFSPFELVLSRPPPHLALQVRPDVSAIANRATHFKRWTQRVRTLMEKASRSSDRAQAAYKRDFDARLRRNAEELVPHMYVFLRREYAPRSDGTTPRRHKLSPIADGPYPVVSVDESTVVINVDGDEERVSRDRVVRAPVHDSRLDAALAAPRASLSDVATPTPAAPTHVLRATAPLVPPGAARPAALLGARDVLEAIERDLGLTPDSLRRALRPAQPPAEASPPASSSAPAPPAATAEPAAPASPTPEDAVPPAVASP